LKPHVNSRPILVAVDAIVLALVLDVQLEHVDNSNKEGFLGKRRKKIPGQMVSSTRAM
jgi:hypothetical protein